MNKPCGSHFDQWTVTHGAKVLWEPVHRLDFETSGILLLARPELVEITRALFKNPDAPLKKIYLAGTARELPDSFTHGRTVQGFIGSRYRSSKKVRFSFDEKDFKAWHSVRKALHQVRPASDEAPRFAGVTYEVELLTGARHQIRAFFASVDAPIVGDPVYGPDTKPASRLELHSWKLEFEHPLSAGDWLRFEAPLVL